jgi:hypothetical protein
MHHTPSLIATIVAGIEYDEGSAQPVMQAIEAARAKRVQDG